MKRKKQANRKPDNNWQVPLRGLLKQNEPLSCHTSFRIGGNARYWYEPRGQKDLEACVQQLKKRHIPYYVIGNGTNVLFHDRGFSGVVIKLSSGAFGHIRPRGNVVCVGAGVSLGTLVNFFKKTPYTGYEFLVGIPGTVGGALITNAGITFDQVRYNIGDLIISVTVLDKKGKVRIIPVGKAGFCYRGSKLNSFIILGACLKMHRGDRKESRELLNKFLSHRKKLHRCPWPNAGCIFKNPARHLSAGALIDRAGLKGKHHKGAMVSPFHANYIVNTGGATACDVVRLIEIIKKKVYDAFTIRLRQELRIVPYGT